jgi:DNA-binding MarR family transcriptional regulator
LTIVAGEAEIEAAKRESVGHLLLKAARLFNERGIARVRAETGADFRAAHTALLPHIDFAGTRLTELAARVGTSKQAVGELVAELEAMGMLRRTVDPSDARARLVSVTPRGKRALLHGLWSSGDRDRARGRARTRDVRPPARAISRSF